MSTYGDPFIFLFSPDDTHYYKVDSGGNVALTTVLFDGTLDNAPEGWLTTRISYKRDLTYWGVFRSFTLPYSFNNNAALILRYIYYNQGVEGICRFKIMMRDYGEGGTAGDWTYSTLYTGIADFSTYRDNKTSVTVTFLDGGLVDMFRANKSTTYQIPITTFDRLTVNMNGIYLQGTYHWLPYVFGATHTFTSSTSTAVFTPLAYVNKDGDYDTGTATTVVNGASVAYADNTAFTVTANFTGTVKINVPVTYQIVGGSANSAKLRLNIYIFTDNTYTTLANPGNTTLWIDPTTLTPGSTRNITATASFVFNFTAGQRVVFFTDVQATTGSGGASNYTVVFSNSGTWDILAVFKLPATKAAAYRYIQVYEKLTQLMTGSLYTGVSTFLNRSVADADTVDNVPYNTVITTRYGLTNLETPLIKTTMDDLFKDASGRWCLGMGINAANNQLILEHLSTFFDSSTVIADLTPFGDVTKFEVSPATEYLYNTLNVGQPNQSNDTLNGLDEPNCTQNWQFPLMRKVALFDRVSPWRRDMYGEESTRSVLTGQNTTDSTVDQDIFLISINNTTTSGAYNLYRPVTVSGFTLNNNDAYNLDLSPKRDFIRNDRLLRAICHLQDADVITFLSAGKNPNVSSDFGLGTGTVVENANVNVNALRSGLFKPVKFKFSSPVQNSLSSLVAAAPYGCVKFNAYGLTLKGFPMNIGFNPGNSEAYDFELLCTPDTDITQLIKLWA